MDTMTFTKVAAGLCGSLLVFLLGQWAATELFSVGGHSEQAYVIETEESEPVEVEEEEEVPFEEILASADIEKGAGVFRKCSACHKLEAGENGTGPYLYGVVGRPKGAAEGFDYSETLAEMDGAWTPENLNAFLEKPSDYAPGTSMAFAGLRKVEERANVIAYMDSLDD